MARVKVLVNNVTTPVIETQVKLEGERAIDESILVFPAGSSVCVSDEIKILQDAVDLNCIVGMYNFQGEVLDESGLDNDGYGAIATTRRDLQLKFCTTSCTIISDGYREACIIGNGAPVGTCGKLNTKAIDFDGCNDYVTVGAECVYDFDQTTPFSVSAWVKTSDVSVPIISKKATVSTDKGWEVSLDSCGRPEIRITSTACSSELHIRGDTSINTCAWVHLGVTYNGIPGCGGSAISIYINGDADTKGVITNNLTTCTLNCSLVTIASYADGTPLYLGVMDDISIWSSKTITEEENRSVFNKGIQSHISGRTGCTMRFNGTDTFAEIPYTTDHDFTCNFDISLWARWQSCATQYMLARRTLSGNGFAISVNRLATGDVVAEIDGNLIKTCGTAFNDFDWHYIRVYRDTCNVVHLDVDNAEQATATVGSNLTLVSPAMMIGTNHNKVSYFCGDINTLRLYGKSLNTVQATRIYTCVTATAQMKFGGTATKVTKEILKKHVVAQSFGEDLGITEVRAQEYNCRSPEFIMEDLVRANTSLIPHVHGTCSGIVISRYNADGKLIDIIRDMTQLIGRTFNTDALNQFHIHDTAFNNTCFVFTHGCNVRNFEDVEDDTEIINDLLVIGENKKYTAVQTFSGNACQTEFILCHGATSSRVLISCVEQTPEDDFNSCVIQKTIVFTCAPACGACNILVEYQYELPLLIRGEKGSSIDLHGRHSKRLVMPWIKNRNDGIRFINGYLNRFKEIRASLKLELGTMKNSLNEGDVVRVVNDIKGIDDSFVVKSLTWRYPEMKTDVLVGEFKFDDLEYEKQIIEKLHDLEGALTEVKEIRCSEQLEEVLCLTDAFNVISGDLCGTVFVETLCLTDGITITVVSPGVYNVDIYNGGAIYGTCTISAGYTGSGFTDSGYTTDTPAPVTLAQEDGDAILLEDGDELLLE